MKLNKEQRLTLYLIMMAEIEYAESINRLAWTTETAQGFCSMIDYLTDYSVDLKDLPELMNYCPSSSIIIGLWFNICSSGWLQRKELLQRTIDTILTTENL